MAEGETGKHPGGRPTKYTPEILRHTQDFFDTYEPWYEVPVSVTKKDGSQEEYMKRMANPPPSILALHRYLRGKNVSIARSSLYLWAKEPGEFSETIKNGLADLYPEVLQENSIMGEYAQPFAIFSAKNRMGWHDKQEVDHNHRVEPMILQDENGKTLMTLGTSSGNKAA